jgi:hypothetical protein
MPLVDVIGCTLFRNQGPAASRACPDEMGISNRIHINTDYDTSKHLLLSYYIFSQQTLFYHNPTTLSMYYIMKRVPT